MFINQLTIKKKFIDFVSAFCINAHLFFFIVVFFITFISGISIFFWLNNHNEVLLGIFKYIKHLDFLKFKGLVLWHSVFLNIFYIYVCFNIVKFLYNRWYLGFKNQFFKNVILLVTVLFFLSLTGTMLNEKSLARQALLVFVDYIALESDADGAFSWLASDNLFATNLPYILLIHCILSALLILFLLRYFLIVWKTFNISCNTFKSEIVQQFKQKWKLSYSIIIFCISCVLACSQMDFLSGWSYSNYTNLSPFYKDYFFESEKYFIRSLFTKDNYKILIFIFYFFLLYFLPTIKHEKGFLFLLERRLINYFFFIVWFLSVSLFSIISINFTLIIVQNYESIRQIILVLFLLYIISYIILYLSCNWKMLYFILNFVKKFKFVIELINLITSILIQYFKICYNQYPVIVTSSCYIMLFTLFFVFFKSVSLFNLWIICFFVFIILLAIYLLSFKFMYKWKKTMFISNYFLIFLYSFWFILCLEASFDEPINVFCSYVFIFYNESLWSINFITKLWLIFFFILFYFLLRAYLNFSISNLFEMPILFMFSFVSILYVGIFNDIFSTFITIEIISLIIIGICGVSITKKSAEVALKYFTINIIVSSITLFGILMIYFIFKTSNLLIICNMTDLSLITNKYTLILKIIINVGVFLWLLCFFFKLGIFPLNLYVPDIYESTSLAVVFFISSILKPIIFFTFTKIYYILFNYADVVLFILNLIFLINIFVGDIKAINSDKIRRSFGHVSIGQYGFLCISLAPKNGDVVIFSSLYLFIYNALLFLVFLLLVEHRNFKYNQTHIEYFSQLSNFIKYNIHSKYILILCVLLLSSLPPSILFIYKYFIFLNILIYNNYVYLFIILIINLLNYFYYFKILVDLSSKNSAKSNVFKSLDFTSYLQNYKDYYFLVMYIVLFVLICCVFYFDVIYQVLLITFYHLIMFSSTFLKKNIKVRHNIIKKISSEVAYMDERDDLLSKKIDTTFMDYFKKLKKTDPLLALKEMSAEILYLRRKRNSLKEILAYNKLLRPKTKKIINKIEIHQEAVNKADSDLFVLMKTQKNFRAFIKRKKDFFENTYFFTKKNFKNPKMLSLCTFSNGVIYYEKISKSLKYFLIFLFLFLFFYFFLINNEFTFCMHAAFLSKLHKLSNYLKNKFSFFTGSFEEYRKKILYNRVNFIKKDIKSINDKIGELKDGLKDARKQLSEDDNEIAVIKQKVRKLRLILKKWK